MVLILALNLSEIQMETSLQIFGFVLCILDPPMGNKF